MEITPKGTLPTVPCSFRSPGSTQSAWLRRRRIERGWGGAWLQGHRPPLALVPPLLVTSDASSVSISPTGKKLGLGFTYGSQGHLRLRPTQPPPSRSSVDFVFSLTFWIFLEVSACTLEDLLSIFHQQYRFLFLVGFLTQPWG